MITRSTWQPGCPVGKDDLAWIRMTYRGFDDARHSGEMLVNGSVAGDVVGVFRQLYRAKFPIESSCFGDRVTADLHQRLNRGRRCLVLATDDGSACKVCAFDGAGYIAGCRW